MTTLTEYTVIVLLSLGVIKMIVGTLSPNTLLNNNPMTKLLLNNKNARWYVFLPLAIFMIFVSLKSNISFAQWFAAGYTMLIIFVGFIFLSNDIINAMITKFANIPEHKFRIFCVVMLALELIGLYVIIY